MDYFDDLDEELEDDGLQVSAGIEGSYICDTCGEDIVVPLDISEGRQQQYVEDCPVCCNPSVIVVEIDEHGNASVFGRPEQDRY